MLSEKVIPIRNNEVYEQIEKWFKKLNYKSEDTMTSYKSDVKRFFKIMRDGKELYMLDKKDVQVTMDEIEEFIAILKDGGKLNNKTINRNITAVKEMLKYLKSKKIVYDISDIDLVEQLPIKKNKYGILSHDEVKALIELAKQEREKPFIKSKLIEFAFDTCIRLDAILKIKWNDFVELENDNIKINGVDKGNKEITAQIKKWFYEELMILKNDMSEYVFDINEKTIANMMSRLTKKMNIDPNRKIVFHSLRKAGAQYQWERTHDILHVQKILNHSSPTITQDYLEVEDYGAIGAISSMRDIDEDDFEKVSHSDLINAIRLLPKGTKLMIDLKLNELKTK